MKSLMKNMILIGGLAALLFSCEKDGKKQEFYYPEPIVSGIYPTSGFTLSQVAINGENFGERLEPISVYFGDKKAEIISCKNNRIIVVVPKDAVSSEIALKLWQYEFDNVGKFTVMSKPVITSISSSNTDSPLFAEENDIVTIQGTAFGNNTDNLIVKIGYKTAEVISVQDDKIQVRTPAGYGMGSVSVNLKGYETEYGSLLEPTYTGDLTAFALKNCNRPFIKTEDELENKYWAIPIDWMFNDNFYYEENGTRNLIRPLFFDVNHPEGCISLLCNIWDVSHKNHPLDNAKMYQVTVLPAGKYKITWSVSECATLGGKFGTIIGVTKGEATLPDLAVVDNVWLPVDESGFMDNGSGGKTYFRITDEIVNFDKERGDVDFSMNMVLPETTKVTIGFVANISTSRGGNVNITGMAVERVN